MDVLGYILIDLFLSCVGCLYLYVWLRDRKKIERIKNEKYGGKFRNAGILLMLNIVAIVGAITTFGAAILLLVYWIP